MIDKNKFKHLTKKDMVASIPKGVYCDGCPFWDMDDELPKQANGYCHYLEKNDIQLSAEAEVKDNDGKVLTIEDKIEVPFVFSLLWDGCKECGENDYTEDEIIQMQKGE